MILKLAIEEFLLIHSYGIGLDEIYLLLKFEEGMSFYPGTNKGRIDGSIGLLEIKGFLKDQKPTKKASDLLRKLQIEEVTDIPGKGDALEGITAHIHETLVSKMIELTGKKQKMIQGKYPFLCNAADLTNKLRKVMTKYGIKDVYTIQQTLLKHIERSHKARWEMVMLMEYYILKNDTSKMVTDIESSCEDEKEINEAATISKAVNPKDLF